ncbi:MAG: 50S ribosomal protein L15 [Anaerolineales bacterium]|jgi:large subunit ribosomal protein L15
MKLHDLKPNKGATKGRKRVGRGISAGQGKTAGRGTKGQNARTGGGTPLWHQGGNLPFFRRLPFKRGFTPINRIEYYEVNLNQLVDFPKGSQIDQKSLVEAGIVNDFDKPVVILGRGDVDVPLELTVHRISKSARAKIEAAGGSVELI